MDVLKIQVHDDEVDIESRRNHLLLEEDVTWSTRTVDGYKIMDLLIAKTNYPMVYHWFARRGTKQSHTSEPTDDDEAV